MSPDDQSPVAFAYGFVSSPTPSVPSLFVHVRHSGSVDEHSLEHCRVRSRFSLPEYDRQASSHDAVEVGSVLLYTASSVLLLYTAAQGNV